MSYYLYSYLKSMSIFGKMDPELERKVFIFTTLLVIAMFVTVALYVYAGKQQNLPARELGTVNIRKGLAVDGIMFNNSSVKTLSNGDTMTLTETTNIYNADTSGGSISVFLPTVDQLSSLKQFNVGRGFSIYLVNDHATNTVTVAIDPGDQSRFTFLNDSTLARTNGTTEIIIRRTSNTNYQAVIV